MSIITAFCLVLLVLLIGEVISTRTRAFIPSVFVSAILFLIGFWTFFPKDLIDKSGLGMPVAILAMYLLITHLGTIMSIRELIEQWKTITVSLAGLAGMCLGTLTLGKLLFGWQVVVASTPPLTGGVVASIIMSEAASKAGMQDMAVLAVITYVMKGFIGYPITAFCLKKEGTRLLHLYHSNAAGQPDESAQVAATMTQSNQFIPPVPEKYRSTYMYLAKLGIVAWCAIAFSDITHEIISKFVICLIFGVIASEIGFLERKPLNQAGVFGWLMTALMAFIFSSLAKATPQMLLQLAVPLIGIIIIGAIGMGIVSIIVGTKLGYSKEMALAIALTAFFGFPPNYVLTEEAAKALAKTTAEQEYLMKHMLPQMLVGGFTSVTVVSVIIAGFFAHWL